MRFELTPSEYQSYLTYELQLEKLFELRYEKLKQTKADNTLTKDELQMYRNIRIATIQHVHYIYERANRRFTNDITLWEGHIAYLQEKESHALLDTLFGKLLALHPTVVKFWIQAAVYELQHKQNLHAARVMMQQSIRVNKSSPLLWKTYFDLETLHVLRTVEREHALLSRQLQVALQDSNKRHESEDTLKQRMMTNIHDRNILEKPLHVVYKFACEALDVKDMNTLVEMYGASYSMTESLSKSLEEELQKKFGTNHPNITLAIMKQQLKRQLFELKLDELLMNIVDLEDMTVVEKIGNLLSECFAAMMASYLALTSSGVSVDTEVKALQQASSLVVSTISIVYVILQQIIEEEDSAKETFVKNKLLSIFAEEEEALEIDLDEVKAWFIKSVASGEGSSTTTTPAKGKKGSKAKKNTEAEQSSGNQFFQMMKQQYETLLQQVNQHVMQSSPTNTTVAINQSMAKYYSAVLGEVQDCATVLDVALSISTEQITTFLTKHHQILLSQQLLLQHGKTTKISEELQETVNVWCELSVAVLEVASEQVVQANEGLAPLLVTSTHGVELFTNLLDNDLIDFHTTIMSILSDIRIVTFESRMFWMHYYLTHHNEDVNSLKKSYENVINLKQQSPLLFAKISMKDVVFDTVIALVEGFTKSAEQESFLLEVLEQATLSGESNKAHYETLANLYRQQGEHEKASQLLYKRRRLE